MKRFTFVLFLPIILNAAYAQIHYRCATQEIFERNARNHSGYADAVEHAFHHAKRFALNAAANKKPGALDTIYRIPVVVHIVYHTPEQNLDDSLICNQIEVLNQDYRRLNPDTGNTRAEFKSRAADTGIEFFLATTDPYGNPTTGITRDSTAREYFSLLGGSGQQIGADEVKSSATGGVDAWDTENYLNIWVCNLEDPTLPFGAVLGFSYPPDNAPHWPPDAFPADPNLHGIVMHYKVFGRNNPLAVPPLDLANRGRALTHEVGHYLGLRHIWGDGPLSILGFPDCSADDGIDDTPNSGTNTQLEASLVADCSIDKNTCTDAFNDLPDMWENFMDYSKEVCQNMFTQGQAAIMRAMLATSRSSLPVTEEPSLSAVCFPAVSASPADDNAFLSIYPNPADEAFTIETSGPLQFYRLTVSDVFGRTVNHLTVSKAASGRLTVSASGVPKGIYLVHLVTPEASSARKVMIQ